MFVPASGTDANGRMMRGMRHLSRLLFMTGCVAALLTIATVRPASAQGQDFSMRGQYNMVKDWITKAAAAMPEADYTFKPTPEVRSFGQLIGHIANATGMICTSANGGKSPLTGNAEQLTSKAELQKALTSAFAACDAVWNAVTPAWHTETVSFFGGTHSRMTVLTFNTAHDFEHYGNVVTYLRLKGIVPPSSGGN
jgi:uncharacterized damage-inducible protein DinB